MQMPFHDYNNSLRTVTANMYQENNNITIRKRITVTPLLFTLKLQPFYLLCSGYYFNMLGRVLKPTRRFKITLKGLKKQVLCY